MPRYVGMRDYFLQGLLWLYLLGFGLMALSLEPGFLDFDNLPDTNFSCVGKVIGGYYADLETNCQMFHVCTIGQLDEPMDIRFLCLNGTVFDQETRVCERIDEVDCSKSEQFYSLNLELYGNSQPATLEENSETEQPLIIKSTPSTTTSTPPPPSTKRPPRPPFYVTTSPPPPPQRKGITSAVSHRFPGVNPNSADIRFNPEEINISLHPGAPPDIRTNQHQQQRYQPYSDNKLTNSDNGRVIATTTDRVVVDNSKSQAQNVLYNRPTPGDINYEFTFRQEEDDGSYRTEQTPPSQEYHYRKPFRPSQEYSVPFHSDQFKPTTYRTEYRQHPTTQKVAATATTTTTRTYFVHPQRNHYVHHRTERPPQRLQLPLPLIPSLAPISFSSPAPFTLRHHIDAKRYTKEHQPPPRIIISASASVSDASGRRLNYSLGTIGPAEILDEHTYDDYKDHEEVLGLEHFYHDVPKLKLSGRSKRRKRSAQLKHSDVIRNDEDAVRVLKFLFDWYRSEKTNPARTATTPLSAAQINDLLQDVQPVRRHSIHTNYTSTSTTTTTPVADFKDYVDDNYEPDTYKEYKKNRYDTGGAEGSKNYTWSLDYVDDNIEPLYYRGRGEVDKDKILEQRSSSEITESNLENHTTNTEQTMDITTNTEQTMVTTTTTPPRQHNTEVSFVTEISEHLLPNTSESLVITIDEDVNTSNDTTTLKPTRASRGRRKFKHSRNKSAEQDQDSFKNVLIEKLIERPYRAQDDYNFLRTLSNVHSSTIKVLTPDDTLVDMDESIAGSLNVEEAVLTTTSTTTTERTSRTINRRRKSRRKSSKETDHEELKGSYLGNEISKVLPSLKSVINNNTHENKSVEDVEENKTGDVGNNTGNQNILQQRLFEEISRSFQNNNNNLNTTESSFDNNHTYEQINRIDEVYPTSPSGIAHKTKKKQLKITVVDTTLTPNVETTTSNEEIIVEESKENLQIPTYTAWEHTTQKDIEDYTTAPIIENIYTTSPSNENIYTTSPSNEDYTTPSSTEDIEDYTTPSTTDNGYTTPSSTKDINSTSSTNEDYTTSSTTEDVEESTTTIKSYVTDDPSWTANDLELYVKEVENVAKNDVTGWASNSPTTTETTPAATTEIVNAHLVDTITENIPTTTTTEREETVTEPQSTTTTEKIETTTTTGNNFTYDTTISESTEPTTDPVPDTTMVPTTLLQETTSKPPPETTTTRPSRRRNGRRRPAGSYQRGASKGHRFDPEQPTDAPLWRSASPTQRGADAALPTTPLSRRTTVTKRYFFNCFNKEIDRFYPDPRDCRLFHYCTQGYNENQLLDMKFVCDQNTYFDDENLVCTKRRPRRCL